MDLLAELCSEILEAAFSWLTNSHRIPKPARLLIATIPHIGLMILFGLLSYQADTFAGRLLSGGCCVLFLTTWFLLTRKIYRS